MKKIIAQAILFALCLVSCKNTSVELGKGVGELRFSVVDFTDYISVETKSGVDFTALADYDVVIDGPTKVSEKYSSLTGRIVELGSGHYTITVTSPLTSPAAFNQPIYQASAEFDIRAGEVTPLSLTCTPLNCMVSINLSDNFKKELAMYEVVVSNGMGQLTWIKNAEKDDFAAGLIGYFLPRGLEVKVKGYRNIDNTEATSMYYVENPQPADHHVLNIDAKVTGQIGGITISVVSTFNEVKNEINVPGLDESYVDRPDFGDGEGGNDDEPVVDNMKPSITWAANPLFDEYTIQPTSQVEMLINAPRGIKTFRVEVSDNFKEAIKVFTQSDKDYIDLVDDAEIWGVLPGLPVGDQVLNQTQITFTLTPFVSTLCNAASGMTVSFTLIATDNADEEILIEGDTPVVTLIVP
jgi:hypothetical protein